MLFRSECDGHIARLPGLEEGSRPLHELTQLPAVHLQLVQGVLVGQPFTVKVAAKEETTITFDANHEMAGKELNFTIELVEVK